MTDDKKDELARSLGTEQRTGLTRRGTGDLVTRGLADLQSLAPARPASIGPEECYERGMRLYPASTEGVSGSKSPDDPDQVEAAKWFRLAAEQGYAEAQYLLATMYWLSHGVPEDLAEMARWFRLAAEQGHVDAQSCLGECYETGYGVPEDYVEAHMWYILSAAQSCSDEDTRDDRVRARDDLAERMTADQLAEAQRRAQQWDADARAVTEALA